MDHEQIVNAAAEIIRTFDKVDILTNIAVEAQNFLELEDEHKKATGAEKLKIAADLFNAREELKVLLTRAGFSDDDLPF